MIGGINSYMSRYSKAQGGVSGISRMFNFGEARRQTQNLVTGFYNTNKQVQALTKSSADFLKVYTNSMNEMKKSAGQLTNGGINKVLYDKKGNKTDETVKATVNSVKDMVETYNKSLKTLNDNADRGKGVVKQIATMADDPAPSAALKLVGVTIKKDATLEVDEEKLTKALNTDDKNQLKLYSDVLAGSTGLAGGIQKDANTGLRASAQSLISNDLAVMQGMRADDPFRSFASYSKTGAYSLNNLAVTGMMMNFFV